MNKEEAWEQEAQAEAWPVEGSDREGVCGRECVCAPAFRVTFVYRTLHSGHVLWVMVGYMTSLIGDNRDEFQLAQSKTLGILPRTAAGLVAQVAEQRVWLVTIFTSTLT